MYGRHTVINGLYNTIRSHFGTEGKIPGQHRTPIFQDNIDNSRTTHDHQ